MSTVFVFHDELPEGGAPAAADSVMLWDTSATTYKRATYTNVMAQIGRTKALGSDASSTISFYGATAINQGTVTPTAVTALATATVSAGNAAGVWGFASSTAGQAMVDRAKQCQADLDNLMARLDSVGLVSVSGL